MLTLHTAPLLRTAERAAPVPDAAVAVSDGLIQAIGPLSQLAGGAPHARVRRWPGVLGPGRCHHARVPPAPSPRERVHGLLRLGATAVLAGQLTERELRDAARATGVRLLTHPTEPRLVVGGPADLAVFTEDGACVATILGGRVLHRRV